MPPSWHVRLLIWCKRQQTWQTMVGCDQAMQQIGRGSVTYPKLSREGDEELQRSALGQIQKLHTFFSYFCSSLLSFL